MLDIKRGDTAPELQFNLKNRDGDSYRDLEPEDTVRVYVEGPAKNIGDGDLIVNQRATDIEYQSGKVTYDLSPGETSRLGEHIVEVVVTKADGEVRSFPPGDRFYTLTIHETTNRDVPPEDTDGKDITAASITVDSATTDTLTVSSSATVPEPTAPSEAVNQQTLTSHENTADAHHARRTDSEVAGALDGETIGPAVTNTRELFGNEEPTLDLTDPQWIAQTSAIFMKPLPYGSVGAYDIRTSGSANVTDNTRSLILKTGDTSGSESLTSRRMQSSETHRETFDKDRSFKTTVEIGGAGTGRTDYIESGRADASLNGFGFKIETGDLYGFAHNGSSETLTAALVSGITTGFYSLKAEFAAGTSVEFYVDDMTTAVDSLSSGLPSGTDQAEELFHHYITNSVAENRFGRHYNAWMVQAP